MLEPATPPYLFYINHKTQMKALNNKVGKILIQVDFLEAAGLRRQRLLTYLTATQLPRRGLQRGANSAE